MLAILTVGGGLGCEDARPIDDRPVCNSWKTDVQTLVRDNCTACHGEAVREGDYAMHEYVEVVAADADGKPRVVPGDPDSEVLTILDTNSVHAQFAVLRPELERWIVSCDARFVKTDLHASAIMLPGHPDFHGEAIRAEKYDLTSCRECHGEDLNGGSAEASCITCHQEGPEDCQTCHADLLEQGAHEGHLVAGALERPTECETCHVVPDSLLSVGHVLTEAGELDPPPVEVVMTGDAVSPDPEAPTPIYDPAMSQCRNVYCHGGTLDDAAASLSSPTWFAEGPLPCDGCHGQPPADHPEETCNRCHKGTTDDDENLLDLALHLDRNVSFQPADQGCEGCHGTADNAAPAPDLAGRSDGRLPSVGLHEVHLFPRRGLGLAVTCDECHRVPTELTEFGHMSGGLAEVFPNVAGVGVFASIDGAMPTYDPETATCSGVYCHGGGERFELDESPNVVTTLSWTATSTPQVFCGSCHGVPPTTPIHASIQTLDQCAGCHPSTVDGFGNILPGGGHLNGSVFE